MEGMFHFELKSLIIANFNIFLLIQVLIFTEFVIFLPKNFDDSAASCSSIILNGKKFVTLGAVSSLLSSYHLINFILENVFRLIFKLLKL